MWHIFTFSLLLLGFLAGKDEDDERCELLIIIIMLSWSDGERSAMN
jgi:hypothetical protein